MRLRYLAYSAALLSIACVPSPSPPPQRAQLGLTEAHTIRVFLDGNVVQAGASDAISPLTSSIGAATLPAFDPSISAPHLDADTARAALLRRLSSYLAPYSINLFSFPPPPSYPSVESVILIGGQPSDLTPAADSTLAGIAPLDCGNAQTNNVAWVFAATLTPADGGLLAVAATAAHELGHIYGLEHTTANLDIMYAPPDAAPTQTLPDLFALGYGSGPAASIGGDVGFRCGAATTIDNGARLLSAVGAATTLTDTTPPMLDWPLIMAPSAPAPLSITATATDDDGVPPIVEVWRNLELYAVLTAPPYTLELPLTADVTFVTLDAFDAVGNHRHVTQRLERPIAVDDMASPTDLVAPDGDAATADAPDLSSPTAHHHGCGVSVIDASSSNLTIWSSILIFIRMWYRRRRQDS